MHRFVLLLLALSTVALASEPLTISVPDATGDQVSRKGRISLKVVVTNTASDEPLVFLAIAVERKSADGKFTIFRGDIGCPCDARCKKAPVVLRKSESRNAEWDLLGGRSCNKADAGIYRFAIVARTSDSTSGNVYHGLSKDFAIIE